MKNKSSLKTFLNGKNKFDTKRCPSGLKGSVTLFSATYSLAGTDHGWFYIDNETRFYIDVLDDRTAITYCPDK